MEKQKILDMMQQLDNKLSQKNQQINDYFDGMHFEIFFVIYTTIDCLIF